ncbi:SAM-dependent methyltransferase [Exiguobacterium sp. SL14]|nr:SAM-dependent methyltransferase [Exiguobacterium sp. SL14]MCY1691587.1 SAM-dependent methyltransferase [Exiguobacterium sp. SL14]
MKERIVIGAGPYHNNPGWYHTQEDELNLLNRSDWERLCSSDTLQAILAEHVWEHLTLEEGKEASRHCYAYLAQGGYVRCAVPDGYFRDDAYQTIVQVGGPGPADHPATSHKIVYTYETLQNVFEEAGFKVQLLEYFDRDGIFHQAGWDGADGVIFRSKRYDPRNAEQMKFPSLILDAIKSNV